MWVRALQVLSVLVGIAALVRERVRAVVVPVANTVRHRPRTESGGRHAVAARPAG
ncbi:hypothetical protein NONO_c53570 [Nocardia nova SH22a]|uniref:Uncharacterized protein n=2 Tax=Nocardia nova TaxID=37330 RepID=W5TLJ0_9NOCA|nr:hypothetical protein NONO_c53570 [Nocardia nova SH22a]